MARGKNKLRKLERAAAKTPLAEAKHAAVRSLVWDWDAHAHDDEGDWEDDFCDHENLQACRMDRVKELLSDLFSSSFKLAVPSLYRGMIQNLQDQVLKEKIATFIQHGFNPNLIEQLANDWSTKEGIRAQIMLACKEELADVVLRLSTEDSFDLLCDLAVRHGRDLKTWGPPCACSFSRCLPCLERLVESIKTAPPVPPIEVTPIESSALHNWIKKRSLSASSRQNDSDDEAAEFATSWTDDAAWKGRISSAWQKMATILWQYADEIDPLEIPRVKGAYNALRKVNGLDLYYTIVTREVAEEDTRKDTIVDVDNTTRLHLSKQYERMKNEIRKLHIKPGSADANEDDWAGVEYRKALARAIREKGNQAYAAGTFQVATDQYTRALGYDAAEPIYPLNRAACLLKLKRFAEAERDCTAAILLDPENHKAYFRRGVSRTGLAKTEEAKEDFNEVLRLQKANPQVREELRKLSERFLTESAPKPNLAGDSQSATEDSEARVQGEADGTESAGQVRGDNVPAKGKAKAPRGGTTKEIDASVEPAAGDPSAKRIIRPLDGEAQSTEPGSWKNSTSTDPSVSLSSQIAAGTSQSAGTERSAHPTPIREPSPTPSNGSSGRTKRRDESRPTALLAPRGKTQAGVDEDAEQRASKSTRPLSLSGRETSDTDTGGALSLDAKIEQGSARLFEPDGTKTDLGKLHQWLRRTREVLVEIQFAHYFALIVERETGVELNTALDEELRKCTTTILSALVERKKHGRDSALSTTQSISL